MFERLIPPGGFLESAINKAGLRNLTGATERSRRWEARLIAEANRRADRRASKIYSKRHPEQNITDRTSLY